MKSLVFFGTDKLAETTLEYLVNSKKYNIIKVVTQPDRPVGRKQILTPTPVKELALKNGLSVITPISLKTLESQNEIPMSDIAVVCVYGLIIPEAVLKKSRHGVLNIHPSLLPKYRGPSPVQSAILNGETEIGISIMLIDAEMDHGPILKQTTVPINSDENYSTVMSKLGPTAADMLINTMDDYLIGNINPTTQNHDLATYTKIFTRDDGKINWHKTATEIYNQYRALTPWPGIFTTFTGQRLKLLNINLSAKNLPPGQIFNQNNELLIGTSQGSIVVLELQLEGGKPLPATQFLTGHQNFVGSTLI